ncbi:MAG: hypothetical protein ABL895_17630 [Cyclobacteriaceae bacterium]
MLKTQNFYSQPVIAPMHQGDPVLLVSDGIPAQARNDISILFVFSDKSL